MFPQEVLDLFLGKAAHGVPLDSGHPGPDRPLALDERPVSGDEGDVADQDSRHIGNSEMAVNGGALQFQETAIFGEI